MKRSLVSLLAALLFAGTVHGHTKLASSSPADAAAVAAPLEEITLRFESAVRLTAVVLADSAGTQRAVGEIPSSVAAEFVVAVRDELPPGDYVATWRAVGADTHVVSGEIHFTIASPHSH